MSQIDWAKTYAAMDDRINLKYEQLPSGEQIGKGGAAGDSGKIGLNKTRSFCALLFFHGVTSADSSEAQGARSSNSGSAGDRGTVVRP